MKLAVVGCGGIAQLVHIPSLLRLDEAELVAVCDRYADLAEAVAQRYGIARFYSDSETMYEEEELDAVLILTPPDSHAQETVKAARSGKHVLVEKPMAMNPQECETMVEQCRRAGVSLMVAFMKRFDPGLTWLKQRLERGELGDVFAIDSWYFDTIHHMEYVRGFNPEFLRPRRRESVGAARWGEHKALLLTHGIHHIDLLQWMGGEIKRVVSTYRKISPNAFLSTSIIEYEGGASGCFQLGGTVTWDWQEGVLIHGTEGSAQATIPFPYFKCPSRVTMYSNKASAYVRPQISFRDQYLSELHHFVDCVAAGRTPRPTGEEGLRDHLVLEAIELSAREERPVRL